MCSFIAILDKNTPSYPWIRHVKVYHLKQQTTQDRSPHLKAQALQSAKRALNNSIAQPTVPDKIKQVMEQGP